MPTSFHHVPSSDEQLAVSVDLPSNITGTPLPGVIVVHGLTGQRLGKSYHLVEFGRRLNERGIACIRFDQRGCGESTGRFVDLTIPRMIEDTLAVRAWAASSANGGWCDPRKLGYVGLSLGALVVVAVEAEHPACAVAMWAGVYDMPRVFGVTAKTGLRAILEHQGWVPYRGLPVGRGFVEQLGAVDTPNLLPRADSPILLCHSEMDEVVKFHESECYHQRCQQIGRPCEMVKFTTADHDFTEMGDRNKLLGRTVDFFAAHVGD